MRSSRANNSAAEPTREGRIFRAMGLVTVVESAIVGAQAASAIAVELAVVNSAAATVPEQRTVVVAEATWVAARATGVVHSKALAAAVARHGPPARAAARAGEAVEEVVRGAVVGVVVVVAAVGGADSKLCAGAVSTLGSEKWRTQ